VRDPTSLEQLLGQPDVWAASLRLDMSTWTDFANLSAARAGPRKGHQGLVSGQCKSRKNLLRGYNYLGQTRLKRNSREHAIALPTPGGTMTAAPLSELRRKEIFLALLNCRSDRVRINDARPIIAGRFGISAEQLGLIEREGTRRAWPPLD
jgi:hypothetical protein